MHVEYEKYAYFYKYRRIYHEFDLDNGLLVLAEVCARVPL